MELNNHECWLIELALNHLNNSQFKEMQRTESAFCQQTLQEQIDDTNKLIKKIMHYHHTVPHSLIKQLQEDD